MTVKNVSFSFSSHTHKTCPFIDVRNDYEYLTLSFLCGVQGDLEGNSKQGYKIPIWYSNAVISLSIYRVSPKMNIIKAVFIIKDFA